MKKNLENIEKNELLEYYRSSSGKFAVGNFVGINNDFAIFTSISPFGRFEGYRFIKIEDVKNIGKKKLYLEFMKKRIEERKSKDCKSIILKKDRFFKELFKYFILLYFCFFYIPNFICIFKNCSIRRKFSSISNIL